VTHPLAEVLIGTVLLVQVLYIRTGQRVTPVREIRPCCSPPTRESAERRFPSCFCRIDLVLRRCEFVSSGSFIRPSNKLQMLFFISARDTKKLTKLTNSRAGVRP